MNKPRWIKKTGIDKVFAAVLILAMAAADWFAMNNLFKELGNDVLDRVVYALLMVILLEGLPTYAGPALSVLIDKTGYKANSKKKNAVIFGLALAALIGTWWLNFYLRCNAEEAIIGAETSISISDFGVAGETEGDEKKEARVETNNTMLSWSPVITSVLAFLASWVAFSDDNRELLLKEKMEAEERFHALAETLTDHRDRMEMQKETLWIALGGDLAQMPESYEDFRRNCFVKMRASVIENCKEQYEGQLTKYNQQMEEAIKACIKVMAGYAEERDQVLDLETMFDQLVQDHDRRYADDAWAHWDAKAAAPALKQELEHQVNNALVVARFNAMVRGKE